MRPLRASEPRKLGQYRIEQFIGKGGMGDVYLGRSPSGKLVAVKHLRNVDDPQAIRRFKREFELAKRAKSHYLAEIYDYGIQDDEPWYASEYIPGPTLHEAIEDSNGRGLGEGAAQTVALALCRALEEIHKQGITHRDLKPGNIILSTNGPRIIDFGIAHLHGHTLTDSIAFVTPGFIAPERFMGGAPQRSWDIFALGVIVAYTATGRMPFESNSLEQNMRAVLDLPPSLDGLPKSLESFVRRCLRKDPRVRSTVAAVRDELGVALKDDIRSINWLPDFVKTEVLHQTKQFETLKLTRPYTMPEQRLSPAARDIVDAQRERKRQEAVRRTPPPARPQVTTLPSKPQAVQRPSRTPQRRSISGSSLLALLLAGLFVIGVIAFGSTIWDYFSDARQKAGQSQKSPKPKPTQPVVDPSIPSPAKFTVGKKALARAYDRVDPTNSVTVTKVTPYSHYLILDVVTSDYNGIQTMAFQDSCVRIMNGKWSGVQFINDFTIDFDTPMREGLTKGTMKVHLNIPGSYTLLPNCSREKSVVGVTLGTNSVKNLGFLTSKGDPLPIRAAYRTGTSATIVIPDSPHFDTSLLCVRTPTGPVPATSVGQVTPVGVEYAIVTFGNVPKGSKLYFSACDGANSYQGTSYTLP